MTKTTIQQIDPFIEKFVQSMRGNGWKFVSDDRGVLEFKMIAFQFEFDQKITRLMVKESLSLDSLNFIVTNNAVRSLMNKVKAFYDPIL